jgi:hypothetical protein
MQIATCGTYPFRFNFLSARFAFFDKSGVAPDIIGMFLAVALPVFGAGAINLLLLWVHAPKVISILQPPQLIQLPFLLVATVLAATGILPLFDPRVRNKQTMTKGTPPPFWHKDSSPGLQTLDHLSMRVLEAYGISGEKKTAVGKSKSSLLLEVAKAPEEE